MMMGYYGAGNMLGWFGMGLSMIIHLAFAVMVVLGAVWLFKAVLRNGGRSNDIRVDAHELLKQRYVRGEITSEEYQRMKTDISG